MLSVAEDYLAALNPTAKLTMFGQELNDESYAICKADMLIKGQDVGNIVAGNTLSDDGHAGRKFDYMLSNPPFGVEWKKVEKVVRQEHEQQGFNGRFGPGLPRVSDGSLLFLMHLLSKMRPASEGGCRFGIVLNGSPLFTGGAGSGESEIRRYLLESDLVEAIVALPTDMFYNTGIATYVWIVSNRKPAHRKGRLQLIDGSVFWRKMRKSLGSKRREMSDDDIAVVTRLFGGFEAAQLATVTGADGKEIERAVVIEGEAPPVALDGQCRLRLSHHHRRTSPAGRTGAAGGGSEGQGQGQAHARQRPARHRECATGRGHRRLFPARGRAPRTRRLDRPGQDQGRL
jgi:type I restriction enzyme M protein